MPDSTQPTAEQRQPPSVVAVGLPVTILDFCRYAAAAAGAKRVEACEVDSASTTVAKHRPFAIVVTSAVYGFDPNEFDALAKDVRAKIVSVPEKEADVENFVRWLIDQFEDAYKHQRGF